MVTEADSCAGHGAIQSNHTGQGQRQLNSNQYQDLKWLISDLCCKPVECTYLRCLECIKTLSVDNEAGEWDATVSLSATYHYSYLYKIIVRSRSNLQYSRGTWLHMSSRAVQIWLGEKLQGDCLRARWLESWTPYQSRKAVDDLPVRTPARNGI